jgi:hypothetical protein
MDTSLEMEQGELDITFESRVSKTSRGSASRSRTNHHFNPRDEVLILSLIYFTHSYSDLLIYCEFCLRGQNLRIFPTIRKSVSLSRQNRIFTINSMTIKM